MKFLLFFVINILIESCPASRVVYRRNVGFFDYTDPSHEHHKRSSEESKTASIKKVKGLYLCGADKSCESISEFDIAKNVSFSCNDRNLAIEFKTTDFNNGSKKTVKKTSKFWLHHSITRTSVYTLKGNVTSFILTHSSFLNFN
jgi:hypothetical protein